LRRIVGGAARHRAWCIPPSAGESPGSCGRRWRIRPGSTLGRVRLTRSGLADRRLHWIGIGRKARRRRRRINLRAGHAGLLQGGSQVAGVGSATLDRRKPAGLLLVLLNRRGVGIPPSGGRTRDIRAAGGQLAFKPVSPPAVVQGIDRNAEQDEAKEHDVQIAIGKEQVAQRRQVVLEVAHRLLFSARPRPATRERDRWLAAGTLVER